MTHESFSNHVEDFFDRVTAEIEVKNADYASGSKNPFAAFDEAAAVLGLSREQVWAVFYMKHVQALVRYIKGGELLSEDIASRLTDLAAYVAIFSAMVEDGKPTDLRVAVEGIVSSYDGKTYVPA